MGTRSVLIRMTAAMDAVVGVDAGHLAVLRLSTHTASAVAAIAAGTASGVAGSRQRRRSVTRLVPGSSRRRLARGRTDRPDRAGAHGDAGQPSPGAMAVTRRVPGSTRASVDEPSLTQTLPAPTATDVASAHRRVARRKPDRR